MKAKVENIDNEIQTINKNFVEKSQQQHNENDKKSNIFSKFSEINEKEPKMVIVEKNENTKTNDNRIETNNMMITTIMSEQNISLDEQQQQLSIETGEHLTPTNGTTTTTTTTTIPIDATNKRVNKTKPKQQQEQQQLENVENEKQSEQLNESTETATTTTTTSTTMMMISKMMMMNTTIAEFISSYSAESSDVRDQLSQEVREILRNQYNNQEEQEKEEQDIDANQILLLLNSNNLTTSPNTSNTPTTTTTTNTIPTNKPQIVHNNESVVKNQQHNNNKSANNNWQQTSLTTNENQEIELKVTRDNDNLKEINEMKFEMRSALTNNNNINKTNTIDTSNYKHAVTNPISSTTIKHTNHATNIPQPLANKTTSAATTTRSYLPSSNNKNVIHSTTTTTSLPTTKSSTERSLSLDTSLILPERTRLRRQRRMLSQGSIAEQNEDPVERLNRLRARISGALSQVKGVLKQYSADADADADDKPQENYTYTKPNEFSKPDTSKSSNCPSSSSCLVSSSELLLTNSDKSIQVEKLNNASKQPAEMDKIGEEEEETETDDGPVNFRFVRKVRRRSNFNENYEIQKETSTNLQDVEIKGEPSKLDEETTSIPHTPEAMEHNEMKGNNYNETQASNDNETQVCKEIDSKIPIEVKASEVKKTVKKRIVIVKSKSGSAAAAARRASIAAVESSKIEPTVKKLLPVHIKSQRRPSDSGTLIKKSMLATDSGTCTNGSMEEQEKNVKLMHKVKNNQINLSHLRRHDENAANDIGMNNHQFEISNNNNNNNNIIINSEINENENNNKDNNNDNKNISRLCDIGLMPVNCSTEASSPTTITLDKDTSITIVTLIDDAENLLGVTGDNANLSMNNKDSTITTNQINTRQLVEEARRTSTKLDDQQNTAMVAAMLMLSPLQDVATSRTLEDLRATISDNQHDKSLIAAGDKAAVEVGNLDDIQGKPYQLELEQKTESEAKAEAKETKETALGENIPAQLERHSNQLHENSGSAALIEVNMPESQASPVPVHLGEHNKLRNFEPPFNEQAKDSNVIKKRLVLKKFIRKNSIDTSKVLKKLATLPPSHPPKIEHIDDTPELPEEIVSEAAAESVREPEVVTEESEMAVPVKPPRKVKKKVIIKRQQRRLSVSDTGFFREPVSDEPTEGTASDIEIFEKPISYVTDDEVDGDEVDAKQLTMPGNGENVELGPLKSCMKAREFEVGDWVMYAERFKKTMVRWKKGQVMERITSISYKLDIDGREVPAHISYIKKYTDRKVNFGDKEYLEINYEQVEPEQSAARYYSIWNMV